MTRRQSCRMSRRGWLGKGEACSQTSHQSYKGGSQKKTCTYRWYRSEPESSFPTSSNPIHHSQPAQSSSQPAGMFCLDILYIRARQAIQLTLILPTLSPSYIYQQPTLTRHDLIVISIWLIQLIPISLSLRRSRPTYRQRPLKLPGLTRASSYILIVHSNQV